MARVVLRSGDDVTIGSDNTVYGTARGSETVTVIGGTVTFDGSFNAGGDTIILPGDTSGYTARVSGSTMILTNGGLTVHIPVGVVGLDVVFGNGTLELLYDREAQSFTLGGQPIGRTAEPVEGGNEAPILARAIADQVSSEDTPWSFTVPRAAFSDPDGDSLTYSARSNGGGLPVWLSFNASTRTFSGTPPADFTGTIRLTVTASDGEKSVSDTFTLTVTSVNDAPIVAAAIADQETQEDEAWSFTLPAGAFTDQDSGALTYSATLGNGDPLPVWLSFNPGTRTFSGTPPEDYNGTLSLRVTASDGAASVSDTFTLTVEAVEDAPELDEGIADQSSDEDEAWSFTLPAGTFADPEGDPLTYSATLAGGGALPGWLGFDASTRTFSGTPPEDYSGSIDITVTAANAGGSASDSFTLAIEAVNDAPGLAFEAPAINPAGAETEVYASATGNQRFPSAAALGDGGHVLSWASDNGDGTWDIYARRYDASGNAVGGETLVQGNAATSSEAFTSVAGLADGGYVVTWISGDGDGSGIHARRYDSAGDPVDGAILVNSQTSGGQTYPAVAALADGGYVVTWQGNADIYARRYDAAGDPEDAEALVNATIAGGQNYPAIAALADGGYVIAWESGNAILAQRYSASGAAEGGETQVSTFASNSKLRPSVTALADGGYVVTWMSSGQDGSGFSIHAQRFDEDGDPQGAEQLVNSTTAGSQYDPVVAGLEDGGYVVTWHSDDGSGYGVYAQRFDEAGGPVGGETRINTGTANSQAFPATVVLADGTYVISWETTGGSVSGIHSQRLRSDLTAVEQVALDLTDVVLIGDVDSSGEFTVTLSVDEGELSVDAGTTGADVEGSGTDEVTVTGTLAEIQALLAGDGLATLTYLIDDDSPPEEAELTVTVDDGTGETSATLDIAIAAVNDAPIFWGSGWSVSVDEGGSLTEPAPGVLGPASDPDGDPLIAVLVDGPDHGAFDLDADGGFTYTPDPGYDGVDSFTFQATDSSGAFAEVTITITVNDIA